jgi:hypothetical protein
LLERFKYRLPRFAMHHASLLDLTPCPLLKLAVVFDDRYFMASSELNVLNTLLLAEAHQTDKVG